MSGERDRHRARSGTECGNASSGRNSGSGTPASFPSGSRTVRMRPLSRAWARGS